jgi:hypothetical protein
VFDDWVDYVKQNFLRTDRGGRLKEFPFYYDPIQESLFTFPGSATAYAALSITPYLLPQNPVFAEYLYRESTRLLGWSNPNKPILATPDPRFQIVGLMVARELGDDITARRLRDAIEETAEPQNFGAEQESFGYWFGTGEEYPRGQLSALMMLCETGEPGAWTKAFNNPTHNDRFSEPTVVGVDFPNVGISAAWNDSAQQALNISTYIGTPSKKGQASSLRVNKLANSGNVVVLRNGEQYPNWHIISDQEIDIQFSVGEHNFTVLSGQHISAAESVTRHKNTPSESQGVRSRASMRRYPPAAKPCNAGCC